VIERQRYDEMIKMNALNKIKKTIKRLGINENELASVMG
jgi:ADP-dependent phosphofructokinase/glucokinase